MSTVVKSPRKEYRTLLLKKRNELLASAKPEPEALSATRTPDPDEFALRSVEQDVAVETAGLRSRTLKEVNNALARVAKGTYGVCEACGDEIQPNRLRAIPWARYCLSCEEKRSNN